MKRWICFVLSSAMIMACCILQVQASDFTKTTSFQNDRVSILISELQVNVSIQEMIKELAPENRIFDAQNITSMSDDFIVFETDTIINCMKKTNALIEYHQKEVVYLATSRAGRDGEISAEESDSRDVFTLYTTINYSIEQDGEWEFVRLNKVSGKRLNVGEHVTVLNSSLTIGQTGWAVGPGYISQNEMYDDIGSSFTKVAPSSWYPVSTIDNYYVGAYYEAKIQYDDGTTELVELSNNIT